MIPPINPLAGLRALLFWLFSGGSLLAASTLLEDLNSEIDSRLLSAHPPPSAFAMFSNANETSGRYVRNPGVWTGAIDLSGIGVRANANNGSKQIGTLITPADLIVANHFRLNNGDRCAFVDNQNVTYYATVIAQINVAGDLTLEHVTWIKRVPTTLKVMPILPPDFRRYFPEHVVSEFPVLCTNQNRDVFIQDSAPPSVGQSTFPFSGGMFLHMPAPEPKRVPFTRPIVVGDSSQPIMAVIRGVAVLISANSTSLSGMSYPENFDAINRALTAMGSRHQAVAFDLTGFPTY